jgi:hypothetical protein
MSTLPPPIPPVPPLSDDENAGVPTREVDGERVLDEDVDDSLIDSAEADRAASTGDVDDD